jgi:hypothetical protein
MITPRGIRNRMVRNMESPSSSRELVLIAALLSPMM